MRVRPFAAAGLTLLLSGGCDEPSDGGDGTDPPTCGPVDRYEEYTPGMESVGEAGVVVSLERATPGPPEKGDNVWLLAVRDEGGQPMPDLALEVWPFMPDHGHGSPVDSVVTPEDDAGDYTVDLVFNMGGFWEVTVVVDDAEGENLDEVVFGICIED